ncbi:MAG: multiheme c-type cytochrome [Aurantibacter sp.]
MINKKFFLNGFIVVSAILMAVVIYRCKNPKIESEYYNPVVLATHENGEQFVGSETCMECHADVYKSHSQTAHFNTSAVANSENIEGNFEKGINILDLEQVEFTMIREENSFYQHSRLKNRTAKIPPAKFDFVIGSGVRGQSYATWEDDKLFQLQTSYYTPTDSWVNSPGFPSYYDTERPIQDACLKCHVTFAKNKDFSGHGNQYKKEQIIYGVDCERCHRPSAKHVAYHRKNPEDRAPKFMMRFDSLSRQQRLDVCAQCHSGLRDRLLKGNSFSFISGGILDEYARNAYQGPKDGTLDVHGNQYGLLTESKCFKETNTMDCSTCHDPHKNQRGDTEYFNLKCISCHNAGTTVCDAETSEVTQMENDCIACHMPVTASRSMTVQLDEKDSLETSFYIRTHLIGIYPNKEGSAQ